jgi:hypothetical protein
MSKQTLINDLVRVDVLKEELEYYKTLLQPHDTGHIHTTISFIKERIEQLQKGEQWRQ